MQEVALEELPDDFEVAEGLRHRDTGEGSGPPLP